MTCKDCGRAVNEQDVRDAASISGGLSEALGYPHRLPRLRID
jgi:hypothetical protein